MRKLSAVFFILLVFGLFSSIFPAQPAQTVRAIKSNSVKITPFIVTSRQKFYRAVAVLTAMN